ncbi:hypothetical protein DVH05_022816 [Phytophthora capsici]|nr:hypothetical protein DVH05_022816 [Phytophthora capsici]
MASNMTGPKNVTPQRSLPTRDNNAASSGIYEHPGTQGTLKTVAQRSWRPETSAERQDSPLFKRHCKRPTPSSIDTGPSIRSEAPSAFNAQKPELQASSKVDTKVPTPLAAVKMELLSVQPPRTPQGNATDSIFHEGGLSASQRVRMELSAHCGSRAGSGSRSNSSEDIFAAKSPVSDEKMHGPRSCPTSFTDRGGAKTKMSPGRRRQARLSSDSIVSKLLPTRDSVNSMLVYLHELQRSETSLRKQLVTTKKHTEEDLHHSLSKLSELQRTIQQVERERQLAVQKLDEKDQLILELTTKLKEAEAKASPVRTTVGLPSIAEEQTTHTTTEPQVSPPNPQIPGSSAEETLAVKAKGLQPIRQSSQTPAPILRPIQVQSVMDEAAQFESLSPRSPNRPLWDPWASGGTTPMKNLPPVFTIGSTGLDPIVTTSQQPTTRDEDHELRSILMSPRQAQGQLEATRNVHSEAEVEGSDTLELQYPASILHVDSMAPLSPYPQEQGFHQVKSQEATYGPDSHMEASSTEKLSVNTLLQMDPMLHIGVMPPIHESPFEENSPTTRNSGIDEAACHDIQSQDEVQPLAAPFPRNQTTDKKSAGPHITEFSFDSRLPVENGHQHNADDSVTPDESIHTNRLDQVANGEREQILPTESVKSTTTTPKVQPPFPASPVPHSLSEPVSLETLLVDFFTEVDKKRLKMAKVYGKRYEGREKWLFAELSKRYGATKVAALKTRYENGSGSEASATSSSGPSSKMNEHFSKPTGVSKPDQPKGGRQGHPRHPQFFHPPAPANIVDLSAGSTSVPPPVAVSQGSDTPIVPPAPEAEGPGTTAVSSDKTSRGQAARVSPRQRRSVGSIPPLATAPPSTPDSQASGEGVDVPTVGTSGPPMMTNTRPSLPREEPARHVNKHPPPPPFQARRENTRLNNINNENTEPVGLRQRHNAPRSSSQDQKTADAERPGVSLEGLLKELYKKHQPDKLKNVSIVAKQYAGKERELVGLLKGKYGALSVKHLEENLEVLERAHIARMAGKGAGKKRGCVVRTISLVFWVSVVLYFSFGAVFVSVVVLDVWECHSLESDEQELEAEECAPLKKELGTFTYEHVADYVSQSHPESCFCSEWKARESALFANLSGDELLNLVRLVPFSPESFGAPWIASVKEQVPSQEFYDSYAKPVVDVSLDIGSSVWSSVLELAGYDEASKQTSEVVRGVVEDDKEDAPLMDVDGEQDAYSDSLEQTSEDVDNESLFSNIDADQVLTKDSEIEVDAGSAELPDTLVQVPVEEEIPVEEETVEIGEKLQIDEVEVAGLDVVSAKDFAAVEESAVAEEQIFSSVEDVASVAEESAAVDEENVSSVEGSMSEEEYITVGNSPVVSTPEDEEVGPDNVPGVEESELVDTSEELTETTAAETLVEDASVVDDFATVDKEDHFSADDMSKVEEPVVVENDSFAASIIEEDSPVDSLDLVESEDSSDVEESEAVDTSEGLSEAADGEVTEIVVEDDAVVAVIVDNESVEENEDDAEVPVLSEDEVPDEAIDAVEQVHEAVVSEVSDSASVEGSEASVEKNTLSDDVVEVEVRQEGLDLSYPEMDEAKEDSLVEAIDVSSLAVEEASVSVVNSDEHVSPLETEREVVVESEDVSDDDALVESDTVAAVIDSEENFTSLSATGRLPKVHYVPTIFASLNLSLNIDCLEVSICERFSKV